MGYTQPSRTNGWNANESSAVIVRAAENHGGLPPDFKIMTETGWVVNKKYVAGIINAYGEYERLDSFAQEDYASKKAGVASLFRKLLRHSRK
ncbi:hypothetical protein FWF74_01590 [Candidatus Saccharibacteria bacterium]|nr:hypothetical protein [Candidatus Saccharibacteria bacterium]MCL1963102.1 hypothetical protein [Candidatus Saccharibacteria bacterium]